LVLLLLHVPRCAAVAAAAAAAARCCRRLAKEKKLEKELRAGCQLCAASCQLPALLLLPLPLLLAAGCWLLPSLPLGLRVGAQKAPPLCWQEGIKTSHALEEAPAPAGW
jgi:hypothetical protein